MKSAHDLIGQCDWTEVNTENVRMEVYCSTELNWTGLKGIDLMKKIKISWEEQATFYIGEKRKRVLFALSQGR